MTTVQPSAATQCHTLRFETGREYEERAEQTLNQLGAGGWEVTGFVRFE
jgi:hypothetical protein